MAISNLTTGLRSGICTSTTRPTAPYEGFMIFETDTNRVLVWDNAAWVMIADTDQPPGLQLVKTQTVGTAVSSVTVTGAFSADYDNYSIIVAGGIGSSAAENLGLTMGATATGYRGTIIGVSTANAVSGAYDNNTNNKWIWAGATSPDGAIARIEIQNPFLARNTFIQSQMIRTGAQSHFVAYGSLANTTSYTDFTITPGSGTLTGGTIRVYGYRN